MQLPGTSTPLHGGPANVTTRPQVDKEVPVQLIKEVPVEVVRESHQPLPEMLVDSFETKTYVMSDAEVKELADSVQLPRRHGHV